MCAPPTHASKVRVTATQPPRLAPAAVLAGFIQPLPATTPQVAVKLNDCAPLLSACIVLCVARAVVVAVVADLLAVITAALSARSAPLNGSLLSARDLKRRGYYCFGRRRCHAPPTASASSVDGGGAGIFFRSLFSSCVSLAGVCACVRLELTPCVCVSSRMYCTQAFHLSLFLLLVLPLSFSLPSWRRRAATASACR